MFFQRAQSPHPSRLGGIQIFSDSEGRFLLFPVIRSRSGSSHILAAVKTLSPPLTAPELGTALLAGSVGSMGGHSLLGGAAAGADGGPLLEGNRPVLSGFLSGAPVDCRGVRTSEPGRHLLGLLAPASGEQQLGRGQGTGGAAGEAGQGTAGSAPEDRYGGPAAAGRGGADGSHHAGDWKITGGIAFIYHILLRIKRYF